MSTRRAGLSRFIPLILILILAIGFIAVPIAYDAYTKSLKPKPSGTIETSTSLSPYLTLRIRDRDGRIIYESSQPSHSPTRQFANILAQQLGAQYLLAGEPYQFNIYGGGGVVFPYTRTTVPFFDRAYFLDNGYYYGGYDLITLYIIAGKSRYPTFSPEISWLPAEPGYRFEAGAVVASMNSNATHAWVTLSTSISASTDLLVEDVGIIVYLMSVYQYCPRQRDAAYGGCPAYSSLSGPYATLIWWDKVSPVIVSAGSTLDIGYTFYAAFPAGGNFLSIIFSFLHTPRASEGYVIYDTAGTPYTNYFPEFGLAHYVSPSTYYLWPALRLQWGTGSATSTGPWSPVTPVNKIGEGDAILTVSSLPTGGMVLTLTGIISNPTPSTITVTEAGFQLGGVSGIGALCLRNAGNAARACPAPNKAVLIAYLPTSITLRPGEAVQLVFKISFTSI